MVAPELIQLMNPLAPQGAFWNTGTHFLHNGFPRVAVDSESPSPLPAPVQTFSEDHCSRSPKLLALSKHAAMESPLADSVVGV